jgi:hypothetical protein
MTLVSHAALTKEFGQYAGAHSIAIHDPLLAVAVSSPHGGHGFDLFDISLPTMPLLLSQYRDASATGGDRNLAFSADGKWVFMANEGPRENATGIRVVSVATPTSPRLESFATIAPSGVHTVEAFTIGSDQYVAALNYGVHLLKLQEVNGVHRLVHVGRYATADPIQIANDPSLQDPVPIRRSVYGHDTFVMKDPKLDKTLLYFAYAYQGVVVLDISNPSVPVELGRWTPQGDNGAHYVHAAKAFVRPDGKRILVVEAETFEDNHIETPSPFWIVDASNFASMKLLAKWVNPGGHGADRLFLSTHFFEVRDDHVFLSHYHGGVWVLNITNPQTPTVAGYYQPHADTGYTPAANCCIGWNLAGIPMTFDVKLDSRGYVWAADYATGLYGLRWSMDSVA